MRIIKAAHDPGWQGKGVEGHTGEWHNPGWDYRRPLHIPDVAPADKQPFLYFLQDGMWFTCWNEPIGFAPGKEGE